MKEGHAFGRCSPRRNRQEVRRTGPETRQFGVLGGLCRRAIFLTGIEGIVSAPSGNCACRAVETWRLYGRPTIVGCVVAEVRCVWYSSAVCDSALRSLGEFLGCRPLSFPAYIFLSRSYSSFLCLGFGFMADVSHPKIQEGSFPNNVPALGRYTNLNSVFFHSIPGRSVR